MTSSVQQRSLRARQSELHPPASLIPQAPIASPAPLGAVAFPAPAGAGDAPRFPPRPYPSSARILAQGTAAATARAHAEP